MIHDGDAEFFEDRNGSMFCPSCGTLLDQSYLPREGVRPRKKYDLCATFDGRILVNDRFKLWCEGQGYEHLLFRKVNETPPYYAFGATKQVRFNFERAKTRFENKCTLCGNFESVVGTYPLGLLDVSAPLEIGFYRTDLEFGGRWEKSPLIVVGIRTKELMKRERFRLVEYEPILT